MNHGALDQLLLELVDLDRYADVVAEFATVQGNSMRHGIFTFANEKGTWR
jgi:hypothetical protein